MHTIAVIGANGQVGSEVCLFLSLYGDIKVFPISRTRLGSAFLRICGLSCRHGSVADTVYAPALLEGCDVVVDCWICKTAGAGALSCARRSDIPKLANKKNVQKTAPQ